MCTQLSNCLLIVEFYNTVYKRILCVRMNSVFEFYEVTNNEILDQESSLYNKGN